MVGLDDRNNVSRHPVHSWNESQITERRLALARFAAMTGATEGGRARLDVMAIANLNRLRRPKPRRASIAPRVSVSVSSAARRPRAEARVCPACVERDIGACVRL